MSQRFEDAVARVRALPEERRDEAADVLIDFLEGRSPDIYLTADQVADIERPLSPDDPASVDDELRRVMSRLMKERGDV